MNNPLVSIIVPNYNHAPFLRQRLDSIYNQTLQDFEVIILDDCSTDNSKEIIKEYQNRPQTSHVIFNETNSNSPFKQWAKGFDIAQGKYIWIAESDDWAELNFLEELTLALEKNDNLALAVCESYWEYPDKTVTNQNKFALTDCIYKGTVFLSEKQVFDNHIYNASSVLFKKKYVFQIDTFYQEFKGSGDYLFWNLLLELGDIYFTKKHLNHFRHHPTSTTSNNLSTGNIYRENHIIFSLLKQKGYISFLKKQVIGLYYLDLIERDYKNKRIIDEKSYLSCKKIWRQEIISKNMAMLIQQAFQIMHFK